jgi:hypothetical protein
MKRPIKLALLTAGLIVLLIVLIPLLYVGYDDYSVRHQGEVLAKKIDEFELREGHVPTTLEEIGEKPGRLGYYASGPHHFTITYMDWASARYVYDSSNRQWVFTRL